MLAAGIGGSPGWWMRQDDRMKATGISLIDKLHEGRT